MQASYQELVIFENGLRAIVFDISTDDVGLIILGESKSIKEGMRVYATGQIISVPVGKGFLGRVINPLGEPIDGLGSIHPDTMMSIERPAPGILDRQDVDTPLETGIKAVDAMTPIGKGQRELIVGDRQTGKTTLAIDTIINQKGKDVFCIYVAIGQKKNTVARIIDVLEKHGALKHTIVVLAAADDPATLQYLAPFTGCTMAEYFMFNGENALVIYDDLTKHAWAYRELSLLLGRPPGREAYPGDIFYLHSRLLERSARLDEEYIIVNGDATDSDISHDAAVNQKIYSGPLSQHEAELELSEFESPELYKLAKLPKSGGSSTALPIIETQMGDVSAYIPTNIISITDGQIYLEESLFHAGIRPAINVGISVSRVGGDAQTSAMKRVARRLRLDLSTYHDLAAYAQLGADLDEITQSQINRGRRQQEVLIQMQYQPISLEKQVIVLFAVNQGFSDKIPLPKIQKWQAQLLLFIEASYPEITSELLEKNAISETLEDALRQAITMFNISWAG